MSAVSIATVFLIAAVCINIVIDAAPRNAFTAADLLKLSKTDVGSLTSKSIGRDSIKLGNLDRSVKMEGDLLEFTVDYLIYALNVMAEKGLTYQQNPGIIAKFLVDVLEYNHPAPAGSSSRWNGMDSATAIHAKISAADRTEFYVMVESEVVGFFDVLVYQSRD